MLLNSPPKFHSFFFASSALPPSSFSLVGGTEGGRAEGDGGRPVKLPDLSYRKVSHQKEISSTTLVSSSDEFEEMKEDPSALTIVKQEREGKGKQDEHHNAHAISTVKFICKV